MAWIDGQGRGSGPDATAPEARRSRGPSGAVAPVRIWTAESDGPQIAALARLGFGPGREPGFNHFVGPFDQLGDLELGRTCRPAMP